MMPLTPGAQIVELRRTIGEFEQRHQAAEVKLADCERRLGTARRMIAAQDRRIGRLTSEVARLPDAAASTVPPLPSNLRHNPESPFPPAENRRKSAVCTQL